MTKLYIFSKLIIVFLAIQPIYAQFPYDSGAFFTPERSIIYYNRDEFTVFPNAILETYGCPFFNVNPTDLNVRDPNANPFFLLRAKKNLHVKFASIFWV